MAHAAVQVIFEEEERAAKPRREPKTHPQGMMHASTFLFYLVWRRPKYGRCCCSDNTGGKQSVNPARCFGVCCLVSTAGLCVNLVGNVLCSHIYHGTKVTAVVPLCTYFEVLPYDRIYILFGSMYKYCCTAEDTIRQPWFPAVFYSTSTMMHHTTQPWAFSKLDISTAKKRCYNGTAATAVPNGWRRWKDLVHREFSGWGETSRFLWRSLYCCTCNEVLFACVAE